jgi:hypothetical protein
VNSASITSSLPATLSSGDTLTGSLEALGYSPADGWAGQLVVIGAARKTVSLTASGSAFVCDQSTATWAAGAYTLALVLTKGASRVSFPAGALTVMADVLDGGTTAFDTRTDARKRLDALQAAWGRYTETRELASEYEVAGRRMKFQTVADLVTAIEFAKREVAAEDAAAAIAAGRAPAGRFQVRM